MNNGLEGIDNNIPQASDAGMSDLLPGSIEFYASNLASCELSLDPHKSQILDNIVADILKNKSRYQFVERTTNVPWYLIACIHSRESSLNFATYLGNGQSLAQKTTNVPRGRGPFTTWESGAIDALEYDGLSGRSNWTLPLCLQLAEKYNGTGYLKYHHDILSPYIWSFTDLYSKGKYGSDGRINPNLVDQEPGIAAIFKEMQNRGAI